MALNVKEVKRLSLLLSKIECPHKGLPQAVFDSLINIVPFVACELVIMDKGGILLTWREDKFWRGWHIPGGLLRFKDSFDKRIKEVAKKELGVNIKKYKFLFPINYTDCSRGHAVSLVFLCQVDATPKDGKFFRKMPKDIIKEHQETWCKLKKIKICF
jgi:colanic acid biosynthesis protein WcaH